MEQVLLQILFRDSALALASWKACVDLSFIKIKRVFFHIFWCFPFGYL
jgi:hypothetical protein